jgi:hypothetical protein
VWTVRKLANDDLGQDHWHFHDSVDYSQVNQDSFNDDNDDDSRTIEGFDEDDDYNNSQGGNNRRRNDDDSYRRSDSLFLLHKILHFLIFYFF